MTRVPARLVAVLVLLVLGTALAQLVQPDRPAARRAGSAPVVGATAVCPDLRQGDALRTAVAVGVGGATAGATSPGVTTSVLAGGPAPAASPSATDAPASPLPAGSATAAATPAPASPLPVPGAAPAVADLGADVRDGALAVRAQGPGAAALSVEQTLVVATGPVRGLASAPCPTPTADTWLLGGATVPGETAQLVLANPDGQPAELDVSVLTGEGRTDARPGRGLTVPAQGRLVVPMDTLAPDHTQLAVHVVTTRGRVAAVLRHERADGLVPHGVAYAAAAGLPAQDLVVPALPAGPGYRGVLLANPGEADLQVQVQLTTADGQFVPDGASSVPVPAGATARLDLTGPLAATAAALRITSSAPVLAAGVVEATGGGDVRDFTYVAPAPALASVAVVPDVVLGSADATVLLSAVTGDAVAEVDVVPVAGGPAVAAPPRRIDVPGGRTVAVPVASLLPAGTTGRVAVEVRPDRRASPVHAGVVVLGQPPEGPLLTALALQPAPGTVPAPVVVRDPLVGSGAG